MKPGRILLGILVALALLSLLVYVFGNTRLNMQGSSLEDGSVTFETQFPKVSCRKTFTAEFPFVRLECKKTPEPSSRKTL